MRYEHFSVIQCCWLCIASLLLFISDFRKLVLSWFGDNIFYDSAISSILSFLYFVRLNNSTINQFLNCKHTR